MIAMASNRVETQHIPVLLCFLFVKYSLGQIAGVHITDLRVPEVALVGDRIPLICNYADETGSSLYSLKWYKDGQEFYRHQPGISHHTTDDRCKDLHTYTVQGVTVDCWVSTEREVVLVETTRQTSGEYECEVIGEHPKFRKEVRKASLTVYSENLLAPVITEAEDAYSPLEYVSLNCSSLNLEYIPNLTWFINGLEAHPSYLYRYDNKTLGLMFKARIDFFQQGMISVSCISNFGEKHRKSTPKKLRSGSYPNPEEYQFNAGVTLAPPVKMAMGSVVASYVLWVRSATV